MALTLEGANQVFNRVKVVIGNNNTETAYLFKALKQYLATYKGNPKLQFVIIDGSINSSDGSNTVSQILADAACRVYAIYLKKTGTTACWFKGSNSATTAATDGTQVIAEHDANSDTVPVGMTANEIVRIFSSGKSLSAGLTVTQDTTATGATLTLKANRFDGFVIIGAP